MGDVVQLFTSVLGLRCYLDQVRSQHRWLETGTSGCTLQIGLVPTMGALHQGHLSLVQRARVENHIVIVSIFVNPLQFGPQEDFHRYPRTLEQDRQLCEAAGVDVIFAPQALELYGSESAARGDRVTQVMPPEDMIRVLCGPFRPGHFPGVATVVTKLLQIVQPQRAYFGQKDAQQLAIIKRVVADLNLPVEVVPCPIVREADGLAMSSRNRYLTPAQRSQANVLYRSLQQAEQACCRGQICATELLTLVKAELATVPAVHLEYVELVHPETLIPLGQVQGVGLLAIAANVGMTRLIDNILLRNRQPILAVDGPAGAGKSTVVRRVAQELGLLYLDTGAMYRAVTWLAMQQGIPIGDEPDIAELVSQCQIEVYGEPTFTIHINGKDVTEAIRSPAVTEQVSAIAAYPSVRQVLVKLQREYAQRGGVVMDGRDVGTCVFPDAELKIYLTASVQERARRRQLDLKHRGQPDMSLEELERTIFERDRKDMTRRISPLRKAPDAIEINTDNLTIEEVINQVIHLYQEKVQQGCIAVR